MTLTISHTPAAGTMLTGTARGDGSGQIAKRHHMRWSSNLEAWYFQGTRGKISNTYLIKRLADDLRASGFEVAVEIDDTARRDVAEVEAERAERADGRVERFTGYAASAGARAAAAQERAHSLLPDNGQPLLVDHYSYPAALRRQERAHKLMHRSFDESDAATEWARRAKSAGFTTDYRNSGRVTTRRVERLEADERKLAKASGERAAAQLAIVRDELAYWRAHLARLFDEGIYRPWGREHFKVGDQVKILGSWYRVVRVNAKSVSVPPVISMGAALSPQGEPWSWTDTAPYDKVFGRRRDGMQLDAPGGEEFAH